MAVLFTTLLGIAAILLGYFLYDFSKKNFIRETEAAIDIEIEHILAVSKGHNVDEIISYISNRGKSGKHPVYFFQRSDGKLLAGNINEVPEDVSPIKEGVISFHTALQNQKRLVAAKVRTFTDGSRLLVARDITDIIESYNRLKVFSFMVMGFMLLVVLISFFISTFVVTRINKIANTAKEIMTTGDLSQRIHIDSNWDDLSYLAKTLNDLLNKIESLMQGIRDVSDNIAHDLRTPLTRLKNDLEDLKSNKNPSKNIDQLISETDRILSIFNSLLRIANIEKGKHKKLFKETDISTVLQDVIELYEPLAEEKQITINKDLSPIIISGDTDLLFQMFANLIDNALKFSDINSTITIESKHNNVVITDNGTGIPHSDIAKVFNRFYRSDKSRNTPGSGLGLSMVKAVAELHGFTIELLHNNPGVRVELWLTQKT